MAGHLGKGLGALFPSLSAHDTTQGNVAAEPARKLMQAPAQEPAQKPARSSARQAAPKKQAQAPSASKPKAEEPLDVTAAARAVSRQGKPAAQASVSAHAQKRAEDHAAQHAGAGRRRGRRRETTPRMPEWDEIAHPADLFFGSTVSTNQASPAAGSPKAPANEAAATAATKAPATTAGATNAAANDGSGAQDRVTKPLRPVNGAYLTQIGIDDIMPNPKQPRSVFDEEELKELADSIKQVGVLQPVVVIRREDSTIANLDDDANAVDAVNPNARNAHYVLMMGERRWRASRMAGLAQIPAIVRTATSEQMLRDALLENLQRVQLNPLEEAAAYQQMMQEFGLTQKQLSQAVSKSRPQIANTLRLLQLPASVQKMVASGVISAGHARALLTLRSRRQMEALASRIVKEGLSVRSTEEIVALHAGKKDKNRNNALRSADYWAGTGLPERFSSHLQAKVAIHGNEEKGRIVIAFSSHEDLDRLTNLLSGESGTDSAQDQEDGWV